MITIPKGRFIPDDAKPKEAAWLLQSQSPSQLGGLLCLPGHLGSLQPSTPHPPVALSPEPWPRSSTLSPRMWLQRPVLGHDQQPSTPLSLPHPPQEWEPNGTQHVCDRDPDRAVDGTAIVGHLHMEKCNTTPPSPPTHTQQNRHSKTDIVCTNPKALNTPRCTETDPQQIRHAQTWAHRCSTGSPHYRSGRDPQRQKDADAETETQRDTCIKQ